jgi:hypothetical protein
MSDERSIGMKIAAVQMKAGLGDVDANLKKARGLADGAFRSVIRFLKPIVSSGDYHRQLSV